MVFSLGTISSPDAAAYDLTAASSAFFSSWPTLLASVVFVADAASVGYRRGRGQLGPLQGRRVGP